MICAWTETSSAVVGSSAMTKRRFGAQRQGNDDALPLSAGKFVRIGIDPLGRRGDPDPLDQPTALPVPRRRTGAR